MTPWPVPWLTWRSAELTHAARVASHRGRAQRARPSPPAVDGNWSTRRLCFPAGCLKPTALYTLLQCNSGTHHTCGECRYCFRKLCASPWRPGNVPQKLRTVEFYAQSCTLCMPVMGVARADGLYGHVLCQCDVYATRDAPEAAGTQRRATQSRFIPAPHPKRQFARPARGSNPPFFVRFATPAHKRPGFRSARCAARGRPSSAALTRAFAGLQAAQAEDHHVGLLSHQPAKKQLYAAAARRLCIERTTYTRCAP